MSKGMIAAAGGLSAADKALLLPENLRAGVTIAKVTGTLTWQDLLPSPIYAQDGDTITPLLGELVASAGTNMSNGVYSNSPSGGTGWYFDVPLDCTVFSAVRFHYNGTYKRTDGYTRFAIGSASTTEAAGLITNKQIYSYPGSGVVEIELPESGVIYVRGYVVASTMLVEKTELVRR